MIRQIRYSLDYWRIEMSTAHVLGFPRIGAQRELKFALERYWRDGQGADAERALVDTGVSCAPRTGPHSETQGSTG